MESHTLDKHNFETMLDSTLRFKQKLFFQLQKLRVLVYLFSGALYDVYKCDENLVCIQ